MADTTDTTDIAPAYIHQSELEPLSDEEIASAQAGKSAPVPSDWRVTGGYRSELEISFADIQKNPFPAGMILGDTDEPAQAVVATEQIPELCLFLEQPGGRCTLTVAETTTPLSRIWSQFTLLGAPLTDTRLGPAAADGPTAVIDAGDRLIRATVDLDRGDEPSTGAGDREHFEDISRAAGQFLESMVG